MGRLSGKVAIVTGGARGMGAATSRLFAAEGAKVAITDVLDEDGKALAAELGDAVRFYHHDVTSEEGWADVVAQAEADLGPIDVLVNNAGILMFKSLLSTTREEYERVLQVNLVGEFLGIKAVAPGMIARGKGSIVNISSLASIAGGNQTAYEISKAALNRLTTSTAQANAGKGVRCNAIAMGLLDTPMAVAGIASASGQEQQAVREARNARVPLRGQMGTAWDTAYAALFLASDEARFITGTVLFVDGGMSSRVG